MNHNESQPAGDQPDPRPRPQYGEYAPANFQPANFQPAAPQPQTPRSAPAPQNYQPATGKLGFGDLFIQTFKLGWQGRGMPLLLVLGVSLIVTSLSSAMMAEWLYADIESAAMAEDPAALAGWLEGLAVVMIPVTLVNIPLSVVSGLVTLWMFTEQAGERLGLTALWQRGRKSVPALTVWSLAISSVTLLVIVPLMQAMLNAIATESYDTLLLLAGGTLLGAMLLAVPAVYLSVKLLLLPASLTVKSLGLFAGIKDSWKATSGMFWVCLGLSILVAMTMSLLSLPATVFSVIDTFAILPALQATGLPLPLQSVLTLTNLVTTLIAAVSVLFSSAMMALLYRNAQHDDLAS